MQGKDGTESRGNERIMEGGEISHLASRWSGRSVGVWLGMEKMGVVR